MKQNILNSIEKLIDNKKISEAEVELSKLGPEFLKNAEYLYLRSKIFYINELYYLALDTLLIALEFKANEKIYNLASKIYSILGNSKLSKELLDPELRLKAANSLKDELSGIYRKNLT